MTEYVELGAFGVLTVAFMLMLRWLMGRFDRKLTRSCDAIHATTIAVLTLQQMMLMHDLGGDKGDRARVFEAKIEDMKKTIEKVMS